MLEQIHIHLIVHGERENIEYYYATTCFFSLNSWKSSAVKVLDISQYLSTDVNDDIILIPDSSSGTSGGITGSTTLDDLNNNINNSINDLNKNIENTILGTENDSGEREGGLWGRIRDVLESIPEFLVRLIIPSEEQFGQWITETVDNMSNKGGILLYSKEFWLSMINLLTNAEEKDLIITLPEFKIPTSSVVIWEEQNINVTSYFKNNSNETIKSFYNIYIVLVSGISIFYFCQYLWSLWDAIITGASSITPEANEDIDVLEVEDVAHEQHYRVYSGRYSNGHRFRTTYRVLDESKKNRRPIGFGRS